MGRDPKLHLFFNGIPNSPKLGWNLNVLEMAIKTLHFVQGLSKTPLLCSLDISPPDSQKYFANTKNLENRPSEIQKPRFTNKCPD